MDAYPDDLIYLDRSNGDMIRYTERDFNGMLDRLIAVRIHVHDFAIKVSSSAKLDPSMVVAERNDRERTERRERRYKSRREVPRG